MHDAGAEFPATGQTEDDPRGSGGRAGGAGLGEFDRTRVDSETLPKERSASTRPHSLSRASRSWPERCEHLFEDLRRPARAMVSRAYGRALSDHELDDVYAAAWTATLSALRTRGQSMADDELRAYVLTAVASHASKELRRRSRKPTGSLEDAHEQVLFDAHTPLPDERVIGSESGRIARDLLSSLPPRRWAVMLLRYGWGMSPKEVCGLVAGLSPRAYRKEVTRGVEQLIERLKQVESGQWCESREPILRDYVAGTADEDVQRQAVQHIDHCRSCADLVSRLQGQLHELGSAIAMSAAAGHLGTRGTPIADRFAAFIHRGKEVTTAATERGESTLSNVAASGGARGSGAAGAGALAKLAALGTAGKAAVACVGAGAAATACVAAGVVPGISVSDHPKGEARPLAAHVRHRDDPEPTTPTPSPDTVIHISEAPVAPAAEPEPGQGRGDPDRSHTEKVKTSPQGAPADSVAPEAPPVEQEFGLPSAAPVSASTPGSSGSTSPPPAPSGGGTSSGSGASGAAINQEFGP